MKDPACWKNKRHGAAFSALLRPLTPDYVCYNIAMVMENETLSLTIPVHAVNVLREEALRRNLSLTWVHESIVMDAVHTLERKHQNTEPREIMVQLKLTMDERVLFRQRSRAVGSMSDYCRHLLNSPSLFAESYDWRNRAKGIKRVETVVFVCREDERDKWREVAKEEGCSSVAELLRYRFYAYGMR